MGPPKKEKTRENLEAEKRLAAVVIADSFDQRFKPLTEDIPRCLIPLCNVPLIEYTLEFLAVAGVQDVYIYCNAHAKQIRNYISESKWVDNKTKVRVQVIQSQDCGSVGDVLREIDTKSLIQDDFILVNGDVVSNMKLDKALEIHRNRRQTDKNSIMTMVLKEAGPFHRNRGEHTIFAIDSTSSECIFFEAVSDPRTKARTNIPLEIFEKHSQVQIRYDLIDTQIDICSIDVLALFSENFDYQDIRKDFVKGILESDLLGKSMYCHVIADEYAARVKNTQIYDVISKDVISRWTYPLVPDSGPSPDETYLYRRSNIYKGSSIHLSRSCVLSKNVVVGKSTEIGECTSISDSVIGRNCKIGQNVTIKGAYLWDNCVVEDGSKIEKSILGYNVHLCQNVKVNKGCLLATNVKVGKGKEIPAFTRLSRRRKVEDSFDASDDEEKIITPGDDYDVEVVGHDGVGYLWTPTVDSDDEETDQDMEHTMFDLGHTPAELVKSVATLYHETSDDEDEYSEEYNENEQDQTAEIQATIERSINDKHEIDIAALELNTLKMALNLDFADLREVVIPAILDRIDAKNMKEFPRRWFPLLKKISHSSSDQTEMLDITASYFGTHPGKVKLILGVFKYYYDLDICDEDVLIDWYHGGTADTKVLSVLKPFIEWLENAEEESTEDEDDEDDEE
ncbi:nucleotide-diphospho-sugar transferase [Paraphysoderma sedebokerense]|nr:nucleotide-diphospho-sugar transferase [Paraphysoderma sedebokerense]